MTAVVPLFDERSIPPVSGGVSGWAEISADGQYRYELGRRWADGPLLGWVMLNPSRATAYLGDQTIGKVVHISRREGYAGVWAGNMYGLRSPSPAALRRPGIDPVGPDNDEWLTRILAGVPAVVLAWGANGGDLWSRQRRDEVLALVAASGTEAWCLGRTAGGEPRHPCRLPNATPLESWTP